MLVAGGSRKTFWKRCHFELAPEGSSRVRETHEHPQLKELWVAKRTGHRSWGPCRLTSEQLRLAAEKAV